MNKLQWLAIRAYERAGAPGLGAGALLMATILFYLVAIRPQQQELQNLQARGAEDRQQQLQRLNKLLAEQDRPAQQYGQFLNYFSSKEVLPEKMAALFNAAGSAGLTLGQADYRLGDSANLPLREFRVTMPLSGSYTAIRRFLSNALNAIPGAALEQIRFERRKIGDANVDAEIRIVIYMPAAS